MPGKWCFIQDGKQTGPVELETLKSLIASGQVSPTTEVWKIGSPDEWRPISQIPELSGERPPEATPTPEPAAPQGSLHEAEWSYIHNGYELGPFSLPQMRQLRTSGQIGPQTAVRQGKGVWAPANSFEELGQPKSVPVVLRVADETAPPSQDAFPHAAPSTGGCPVREKRSPQRTESDGAGTRARPKRWGLIVLSALASSVILYLAVNFYIAGTNRNAVTAGKTRISYLSEADWKDAYKLALWCEKKGYAWECVLIKPTPTSYYIKKVESSWTKKIPDKETEDGLAQNYVRPMAMVISKEVFKGAPVTVQVESAQGEAVTASSQQDNAQIPGSSVNADPVTGPNANQIDTPHVPESNPTNKQSEHTNLFIEEMKNRDAKAKKEIEESKFQRASDPINQFFPFID